jgi:tetratricopeptide (TPR) repeat protein
MSEGMKKLEKAIALYPQFKEAYVEVGEAYIIQKEYHNALAEYNRVLKIDARYSPGYYGKGKAYTGLKQLSQAIDQFTLAIQNDAEYMEAYIERGNAYQQRGLENSDSEDFQRAINDHEQADRLKKKYVDLGNKYLEQKDYISALSQYDRVLKIDLKYASCYYGKGKVFFAQKKWDDAIKQLNFSIELDAEVLDAYIARAETYRKRGKLNGSQADLQQAKSDEQKAASLKGKKK